MINHDTSQLLEKAFSKGDIMLMRSPQAGRQVVADVIYFALLFGLGMALLIWRIVIRPNEGAQVWWDLFLSISFLASGLLVAGKIWLLKRSDGQFVFGHKGIERRGDTPIQISWTDLSRIYTMPFVVAVRGVEGSSMTFEAYTDSFSQLKNLFESIAAFRDSTGSRQFQHGQNVADAVEALYRSSQKRTGR